MGLIEPLREIPRLLRLRRSLITRWRASPPDVFVGIDAPDFNLGLEKGLRRSGIRTVHYVSPTVWAWRPGRIESVRKAADRVLCILPFEQALYDSKGIDAVFVGHPRADSLSMDHDTKALKRALGVAPDERLVAVLPGSRSGEIMRLGPVLRAPQNGSRQPIQPCSSSCRLPPHACASRCSPLSSQPGYVTGLRSPTADRKPRWPRPTS